MFSVTALRSDNSPICPSCKVQESSAPTFGNKSSFLRSWLPSFFKYMTAMPYGNCSLSSFTKSDKPLSSQCGLLQRISKSFRLVFTSAPPFKTPLSPVKLHC
uniref:Uncharacterized protein n=1 Tax=Arundo donax TaxID=35708 RepID=A0A0A8YBD1_ARUDO